MVPLITRTITDVSRKNALCYLDIKSILPFYHFLHLLIDFAFNYIPSGFSLLNPFSIENSALPLHKIIPTEYAPNDYQTRRRCSFANDFISKWAIFVLNLLPYSFDRHIKRGKFFRKIKQTSGHSRMLIRPTLAKE